MDSIVWQFQGFKNCLQLGATVDIIAAYTKPEFCEHKGFHFVCLNSYEQNGQVYRWLAADLSETCVLFRSGVTSSSISLGGAFPCPTSLPYPVCGSAASSFPLGPGLAACCVFQNGATVSCSICFPSIPFPSGVGMGAGWGFLRGGLEPVLEWEWIGP